MITYYDDGTVLVTSTVIRVGPRAYPVDGIGRVWVERSGRSWGALAGRATLGLALLGPFVAAALGLWAAVRLDAPVTVTVALVGGACLLGLAAGPVADLLLERMDRSYARGAVQLWLWVSLHGRTVPVLTTRDALRFGQIHRALRRAIESPRSRPIDLRH